MPHFCRSLEPSVAATNAPIAAMVIAWNASRRLRPRSHPAVIFANGPMTLSGPIITNRKVNTLLGENGSDGLG